MYWKGDAYISGITLVNANEQHKFLIKFSRKRGNNLLLTISHAYVDRLIMSFQFYEDPTAKDDKDRPI